MWSLLRLSVALTLALLGGLAFAGIQNQVAAQDATPESGAMSAAGYPIAMHLGTCDDLTAEPEKDLGEARLPGIGDNEDDAEIRGSTGAVGVLVANETVDLSFDNVLDENQYAIAVHQSSEEFGTIVACGEIGGRVADGQLIFGLRSVNESGVSGIAIIDEDSSGILGLGDDELSVKVYLLVEGMTVDQSGATASAGDENGLDDTETTAESAVDQTGEEVEEAVDNIGDDAATPETEG
ncbi:MAG: hypothetical protein AB7G88_09800 [Thermomicrobiales bacterium]